MGRNSHRKGSQSKGKKSEGASNDRGRRDDRGYRSNEGWWEQDHYARDSREAGGKKGKGKGKSRRGKGRGKEPCQECGEDHAPQDCPILYKRLTFARKIRLCQEVIDSDFEFARHLIGEKGINVRHIKEQ